MELGVGAALGLPGFAAAVQGPNLAVHPDDGRDAERNLGSAPSKAAAAYRPALLPTTPVCSKGVKR